MKTILLIAALIFPAMAHADIKPAEQGTSVITPNLVTASTLTVTGQSNLSVPVVITDTAGRAAGSRVLSVSSSNATTFLYIESDGKVGVGTSAPSNSLSVISAIGYMSSNGNTRLVITGDESRNTITTSGGVGLDINAGASATLALQTSGANRLLLSDSSGLFFGSTMAVLSSGLVGIGTTSPQAKVHVSSSGMILDGTNGNLTINHNAGANIITVQSGRVDLGLDGNYNGVVNSPASLYFNTDQDNNGTGTEFQWATNRTAASGGTILMTLQEAGNLGIGTTSPATLLDINGAAQFGSGATKSTFTSTGNLVIPDGGTISAGPTPRQILKYASGDKVTVGDVAEGISLVMSAGGNNATLTAGGSFSVGVAAATATFTGAFVLATTQTPAAAEACTAGKVAWDASYIYICTASGAWKRAALTGGY